GEQQEQEKVAKKLNDNLGQVADTEQLQTMLAESATGKTEPASGATPGKKELPPAVVQQVKNAESLSTNLRHDAAQNTYNGAMPPAPVVAATKPPTGQEQGK